MKKVLFLFLAVLLLLSLCGCHKASPGPVLAFIHSSQSNYTAELEKGFRAAAEELGYSCVSLTPVDASVDAQIALIEQMIGQGVKGIVISGSQTAGLEDALRKAQNAGISVVSLDRDTKGSQVFIHQANAEQIGITLMDAMLDLTGGEGQFAVISGLNNLFISDPWVAAMERASRDSRYQGIRWAETNYSFGAQDDRADMEALVSGLLQTYPDLEAICCTGTEAAVACCQAVEALGASIKVTGMAVPSQIKDYVGEEKVCPYFFLWNPFDMGQCAAYVLEALVNGAVLEEGGTLSTQNGSYTLYPGDPARFWVYTGPPYRYTAEDAYIYSVY